MNTKKLLLGIFLLISFFVVLFLIFMPIFPGGRNGLEFSDDFFNSLSKGSSNYMADMRKLSQPLVGVSFNAEINLDTPKEAEKTGLLFSAAGAQVNAADSVLKINGDLGKVLLAAIDDSEAMFHNQPEKLRTRYNYDAKEALKNWWVAFDKLDAALKKQKRFKEAKVVVEVQQRAIEPGYNFFGIKPTNVSDRAGLLTFMLVFYVVYTLWFGYGIFELFEGFGLGMGKPHAKKEV
ncbi:MAG: hypothetical protein ACWGN1_03330 [Desulfobulbales bacterium]